MCGCRSALMYSTSRCTRVFVLVSCMTALDIYFIATLWPVTVCKATKKRRITAWFIRESCQLVDRMHFTFYFSKSPLCNILNDCVFTQLLRWILHMFFVIRHVEEVGRWSLRGKRSGAKLFGSCYRVHVLAVIDSWPIGATKSSTRDLDKFYSWYFPTISRKFATIDR